MLLFSHTRPLSPILCNTLVGMKLGVKIDNALRSQQCNMPDIGTLASLELVWYHAITLVTDKLKRHAVVTRGLLWY